MIRPSYHGTAPRVQPTTRSKQGFNSDKIRLRSDITQRPDCAGPFGPDRSLLTLHLGERERIDVDILLIGCGKMGGALLRQWRNNPQNRFTVADPAAPDLGDVTVVTSPEQLTGAGFDAIIIAVKPQMIASALPGYAAFLKPGGCFVSIAAGCSIASLQAILGPVAVVRVMPNLPAMIGRGVSGLYANDSCSADQRRAVQALIAETGTCLPMTSEDKIDRLTAVSGSGPGYVFEIIRSLTEAAKAQGFDADTARALVLGTVAGAAEMAAQSSDDPETLRNSVTSKNGTTEAGLAELRRDGVLDALLRKTVQAAYDRARALQ
jgi:pyrroline-5-carboxylate reductase